MNLFAMSFAAVVLALAGSDVRGAESGDDVAFAVDEFRVLGNSVLEPIRVEEVLYPLLGDGRTLKDVEAARVALEKLYRDRGYGTVFVDVPEQDVGDGVVRLRVTEGRIDRLRVTGARYFANGQIRAMLPAVTPGAVPNLPQFQEQLGKLNRQTTDRAITPVLRAGRTPGTVDVELKVQDELPAHASLEVNDRYTADTSRTRASANLSYGNLFQRFHSLSLQYQTAPEEPKEARVWAATYVAPVTESGHLLAAYAVDTDSEVATIGTLAVLGKGRIYGLRYIMPLTPAGKLYHNVTFGGDFKDFAEDVRLPDDVGLQTPIEYVNWSASYAGGVRTAHTDSSFDIAASLGLRGFGNDPEEFENKRFRGRPNYLYLRASATHERPLLFGTRVAFRLSGQYAVEPLISNEQFSIGGADSVRGYLESEELGDYGANGTLELRTGSFRRWFAGHIEHLYAFAFFDAGVVSILEPLPGQMRSSDLSSWGLGLRFAGLGGLTVALDWAVPLTDTDRIEAGDSRIHFSVRYGF